MCQGNHPLSPLPHPGTTRCWGDPTCWSEHPQFPFSQSQSSWAALSAPNPWRFSSDLEIFSSLLRCTFYLYFHFSSQAGHREAEPGLPMTQPGAASSIPALPYGASWCERCWPRSPHAPPEFSTLRCFSQGFQSHLHGATALPTPRTHSLRPARCQHCRLVLPLPHGCVRARTHGEPPQAFPGLWLLQEGSRVLQLCQRAKGGSWHGETGKTGGLRAGQSVAGEPSGPCHGSGQPTAPSLSPHYLPNSGKMGILGKVLPNFPLPREFTCGSFFQDLGKKPLSMTELLAGFV